MVVGHGGDDESPMAGGEIIVEGEGELAGGSGLGSMFDRDTSTAADHLLIPTHSKEMSAKCLDVAGTRGKSPGFEVLCKA